MDAALLIPFAILFAFALVALFLPLLRPPAAPWRFFGGARREEQERRIRERMLLENLRDLRIEHDKGKLNDEEYAEMRGPLAEELQSLEQSVATPAASAPALRRNRLGWYCPHCAGFNRSELLQCQQCGLAPAVESP